MTSRFHNMNGIGGRYRKAFAYQVRIVCRRKQ